MRKFRYGGDDPAADIAERFGFDGDLAQIFARNEGPVVHKWHHYIPTYDRYFSQFRNTNFRFLEIGVSKGGSLQMWRKYFGADANIFGIDIDPDCAQFDGQAASVRIGSQDDPAFLTSVVEEMGGLDLVLDDGSHHMKHIRASLKALFPQLQVGGLYVIEDLHTCYFPDYGGGPTGNFFDDIRQMVDEMHHWYRPDPGSRRDLGRSVSAMHVHDSMVILEKGRSERPAHSRVGQR